MPKKPPQPGDLTWEVVTHRGTFTTYAPTEARASQKTPGRTVSVRLLNSTPVSEGSVLTATEPPIHENRAGYPEEVPTGKALVHHARLYGPESVEEVARIYGVQLPQDVSRFASKQKPKAKKGVNRKKQAKELLSQGHSWQTIEETLDLGPALSRRLRSELNAYDS